MEASYNFETSGEATYPFASAFPVIQKLLNMAIPLVLFFTT